MATYLKRTSKLFDISLSRNPTDVTLRELMCPVCRGILIEPVSLPCTHNLCLRCLKGTFAHNSLSCPLCRVRVGSWLRTATKSETLVNNELWQLIRTRFPKEVASKYSGDDDVADDGADYPVPDRILSTAGEIRREYEAQLQMAQEELRRQREAEIIASEVLIRKLQAEEQQQQLAQLAEDSLLAKTLAKKQLAGKSEEALKCNLYNQYMKPQFVNLTYTEDGQLFKEKAEDEVEIFRKSLAKPKPESAVSNSNYAFTKPKEHYAISRTLNVGKEPGPCVAVNMTTKPNKYSPEPGCSSSIKIYGLQSKEELHVPNDVINSKKKTLDVEVCVTQVSGDGERRGSAESGGSHDSINQEIHHFKPIKAMPRTPLLLNADGKQIDPKLIRVTPVVKKTLHVLPKPPSPTVSKKIIGCFWSAFKRKWKPQTSQEPVPEQTEVEQLPSTLPTHPKSKPYEDCTLSIDTNKNYTKIGKILNGARKASKKSSPDLEEKSRKSKSKHKHKRKSKKESPPQEPSPSFSEQVVENIAERIKRRKTKRTARQNEAKYREAEEEVEESLARNEEDSENEVIKEQQRIEQIVLQEKRDFELAMRLQAQFDEMERAPVRTRGSRRAIEIPLENADSDDDQSQRKRKCRQRRRVVL